MAFKVTILTENTVPGKGDGLCAEHGFSVFVETPELRLLFDTGPQGGSAVQNAPRLGVDLRAAEAVVLSHGHFDHTGGLPAALRAIGRPVPVYAHPGVFADRYGRRPHGLQYIGMPFKREALEGAGGRFDLSVEFRTLAPGVHLTGAVPRRNAFETGDVDLFLREGDEYRPDPFDDDQSLVLETRDGLALLLGCCHAGLLNTLDHLRDRLPDRPIHTVLGGTHLGFATPAQLRETVRRLKDLQLRTLGLSHCTGLRPAAELVREVGEPAVFCNVGFSAEWP